MLSNFLSPTNIATKLPMKLFRGAPLRTFSYLSVIGRHLEAWLKSRIANFPPAIFPLIL